MEKSVGISAEVMPCSGNALTRLMIGSEGIRRMSLPKSERKSKGTLIKVFAVLLILLTLGGYLYWNLFHNIQRIKWQEILSETTSPNGRYTVTAYLTNGGATTAFGVLAGVEDHKRGRERKFYWQYRCKEAEMEWLSDSVLRINGITLDVDKDTFDYRYD